MGTDAVVMPRGASQRIVYRPVNRTLERFFFSGMAVLLCGVVVFGFSATYFSAGMMRAQLASPILHVHGAVFSLWMTLFLVQSALISARRVKWHRTLGTIAFCLPPIMIVLGVWAAVNALHRKVMIGPLDPATSLAIPLLGIAWFAVTIFMAWRTRRQPDVHKRLVLIATVGLTEAALGRFPWAGMGIPPAAGANIGLACLLVLVVIYDLVALRRVHRTTMWAATVTLVVGVGSVPVGMTPMWHALAGMFDRM